MEDKNHGVLLGNRETDWGFAGAASQIVYKEELPSGDWTPYLPLEEWQWSNIGWDSMACVSFSANNCIETILNHKLHTGKLNDIEIQNLIDLELIEEIP